MPWRPLGIIDGDKQAVAIETNAQLRQPEDYKTLVVKTSNGNVVRLSAVATIEQATRNSRSAAMFNKDPAILLTVTKQGDANVVETVDRIRALIPEIKRWIPPSVEISVLSDRTNTLRASIADMQLTLALAIALVMAVVFVFLRRATPTIAAGITVPLSLAGTCAAMWLAGFSINNLTLMALAVSVGFVVDDAIVMIENMYRNLDRGVSPMRAALDGARQIGFTVVSISISLVAAFIPLLFMTGVVGRLLREFSVTLVFAIIVSMVVSLSVTPMICAHFVRAPAGTPNRFDRIVEGLLGALSRGYARSLEVALRFRGLMLILLAATVALTVHLYIKTPKGYFPQDDTGLVFGATQAAQDISFEAMSKLQNRALDIVLADPAIAGVGSSVGASGFNASVNRGRMFISLKPLDERGGLTTARVVDRLRREVSKIEGLNVFMTPAQDIRTGARQSSSTYQITLWSAEIDELYSWVPKVLEKLQSIPEITDVNNDREQGALQASITIDRMTAARLGVDISDIDSALSNAFSQRQISTIYTPRNQYKVILEVDARFQREIADIGRIYVPGRDNAQIPLTTVIKINRTVAPLGRQSSGHISGCDVLLQPAARRDAGGGHPSHRSGCRRAAHAGLRSASRPPAMPSPSHSRPTRSRC